MLNWEVEAALLEPLVPRGCVLDLYEGRAYVSVVGFRFEQTRVGGVAIPGHRAFEEINLRFYVRREVAGEQRRAVTFIREFVPRRAIAWVARWRYNEPYRRVPMTSQIVGTPATDMPTRVQYTAGAMAMEVTTDGVGRVLPTDSFEAFISEHYWGYTAQRDGSTVEYAVTHPSWRIAGARTAALTGDVRAVYGEWAPVLSRPVHSAWLADGSGVAVYPPRRLSLGAEAAPGRVAAQA